MTADDFVSLLERVHLAARTGESEPDAGLPPHGRCTPRESLGPRRPHNPLEDLLVRFDCTRVALGRVHFVSHPRPHFAGQVVGVFESEPIVLEQGGTVSLFEHERFGEKLLDCAVDGASFLRALSGFLEIAYARKAWLHRLDEAAATCAMLAGGPRHEPFYTALCGYLDYGT
jgi:hypothetical protein